MTIEKFAENLKEVLRDCLPETYDGSKIQIETVQKNDEEYIVICFPQRTDGARIAMKLSDLYNMFEKCNGDYGIVKDTILNTLYDASGRIQELDTIRSYDYNVLKNYLTIRAVPTKRSETVLQNCPHRNMAGNISLMYYLACPYNDTYSTIMVTNEIAEKLGATEEDLYHDAVTNQNPFNAIRMESMTDVLIKEYTRDGVDEEVIKALENGRDWDRSLVITTEFGKWGFSTIFRPGVLDLVAKEVGGNFFIIPSSVHEAIVYPAEGLTEQRVQGMVWDINRKVLSPADFLSDEVFYYDAAAGVFQTARDTKHN